VIWPHSWGRDGLKFNAPQHTNIHTFEAWFINSALSRNGASTTHLTNHLTSLCRTISAGKFEVGCGGKGIWEPMDLFSGAGGVLGFQDGATSPRTCQIWRPAQSLLTGWPFCWGSGAGGRGPDCFFFSLLPWVTRERWYPFLILVLLVLSLDRCPPPGPGRTGA
jgi:hypothetical protein